MGGDGAGAGGAGVYTRLAGREEGMEGGRCLLPASLDGKGKGKGERASE